LGRHPADRKKFAVRAGGKLAVTHWKVLKKLIYLSLVECRLETGRTHQIRVHMNALGHPLLGDSIYGRYRNYIKKLSEKTVTLLKQYQGQALHAKTLGFIHPVNKKWIVFECQRPSSMQAVIDELSNEAKDSSLIR
jgi:23S rRNA pseudouridine1911/1915/1917 synthase